MNAQNPQFPSRSDTHENTLNGIDLRIKQENSFDSEMHRQDQSFLKTQKSHAKFSSPGLWRKKRDIALSKTHFQR